jgi:polysaccharide pyruvyl transferase WcaK-like protein
MRILLTEVGNASPGDEAITLAAAKRLSGFGHELTVAYRTSLADSFRRAGMSAEHVHVPIAPVGPHYATAKALLAAVQAQQPQIVEQLAGMGTGVDAVCVVPGGKFLDGFDNSLKFLTIALARRMGIPYLILHQSVGPLTNRNELDLLQEVFRDAALVVARDHKSFEFLTSLGLSHHRLVLGADAAMPENYPESQSKPYALGVNLRWSALGHSTAAGLRGLLGRFRDFDPQSRVLIYSTTTSLPPEVLSVAGEFGCEHDSQWCRFPDYLQQVGACRVNVTDSFHGVIFSLQANVPTVCLQADMRSWKLQGLRGSRGEYLDIFPSLATESATSAVAEELSKVLGSPEYCKKQLRRQAAILGAGRSGAEEGWQSVYQALGRL